MTTTMTMNEWWPNTLIYSMIVSLLFPSIDFCLFANFMRLLHLFMINVISATAYPFEQTYDLAAMHRSTTNKLLFSKQQHIYCISTCIYNIPHKLYYSHNIQSIIVSSQYQWNITYFFVHLYSLIVMMKYV